MLFIITFLALVSSEQEFPLQKQLPSTYLRPKPKARAGGADDAGVVTFSVIFTVVCILIKSYSWK